VIKTPHGDPAWKRTGQSTECSRLSRDQACVSCTNHRPFPGKKDAALLPVEMQWFGVSDMRRIAFPNMKSLLCFNPPFRTLILILESSAKSRNFTNPMPGVEAAGGPGIAMAAPESP
jgi:hypothetical protein